MKTIKVRTSYTGCPYITAGKVYEAKQKQGWLAPYIINDEGSESHIMAHEALIGEDCPHLNNEGHWEIVPEGPSLEDELAEALELMTAHAAMFNRDTDEMWVARRNHAEVILTKYKEQKQ